MGLVKTCSCNKNTNSVTIILYFPLLILLAIGCSKEKEFVECDENVVFQGLPYHQSMVFCNGKALFLNPKGKNLNCYIYDWDKRTCESQISLPIIGEYVPHANAASFSNTYCTTESIFPAMYVSAWNGNKYAYVYDFKLDNDVYVPSLIQLIDPSKVSERIIGAGHLNWIIDNKEERLISIAYKLYDSDMIKKNNYIQITWFDIPSLSEEMVLLKDSDVRENISLSVINAFQDMFISDNIIYVAAGVESDEKYQNSLFIINLSNSSITERKLPLRGEPEGLCEYKGKKYISIPDGSGRIYDIEKLGK